MDPGLGRVIQCVDLRLSHGAGGSRAMWPNGFDNPHAFPCASWVESFIKIAKSLPLGRLLHGSRLLQWPCQGIFTCPGQFQGIGKRQGGPSSGQACGLAWSFQGLIAVPLGPFKNILPLNLPAQLPAQWPLEMLWDCFSSLPLKFFIFILFFKTATIWGTCWNWGIEANQKNFDKF
jgi:hypothetical protein